MSVQSRRKHARNPAGNGLLLAFAFVCAGAVGALFCLNAVRLIASHEEQSSAVESAALVASRDLGRVYIDDPHFGFVSLVDCPPQGKNLAAQDGYGLPVRSINSILATVRLDLILANLLHDSQLKSFALADYNFAMAAQARLAQTLVSAVSEDGKRLVDSSGDSFSIYDDVLQAYNQNAIRMNGPSHIVAGSLKLTLGTSTGAHTVTPTPEPTSLDTTLGANNQFAGKYLANTQINYAGSTFCFAGVEPNTTLVNLSTFQPFAGQPGITPTCIKVEASQESTINSKSGATYVAAVAQFGGSAGQYGCPGACVISLPDGCPLEFGSLGSLANLQVLGGISPQIYRVSGGDFPNGTSCLTPAGNLSYPLGQSPSLQGAAKLNLYLWLKNLGPIANIQSVCNALNMPLIPASIDRTGSLFVIYSCDPTSGLITQKVTRALQIYAPNSDKQLFVNGTEGVATASTAQVYDLALSSNVYQGGRSAGGLHGGQPLPDSRLDLTINPLFSAPFTPQPQKALYMIPYVNDGWGSAHGGWAYNEWGPYITPWIAGGDTTAATLTFPSTSSTAGSLRPTWQKEGTAVEFAFHKWIRTCQLTDVDYGWQRVQ